MSDTEHLHETFSSMACRARRLILQGLPLMAGVVGVAMSQKDGEASLTVFGVLPHRYMLTMDQSWNELEEQGVHYVMSGPFMAAVEGGDSHWQCDRGCRNDGVCVVSGR